MTAEWNVQTIAGMSPEQNLRNTCEQLEQAYVDWHRPATYRGSRVSREWPAIGELGRWQVSGRVVSFVTTYKRSLLVQDANGNARGEVRIEAGMAKSLYEIASCVAHELLRRPIPETQLPHGS